MKAFIRLIVKIGTAFFIAGLFVIIMTVQVLASSSIDRSKLGSITLHMYSNNSGLSNLNTQIGFSLYKVANLSDRGKYSLTNDFIDSKIQLDELTSANDLLTASQTLANYVAEKNIKGIANETDENGIIEYKNLTLGYYFVMQSVISSKPNNCIVCDPFLIALPMKRSDDKELIYDIVAYPKSDTVYGAVLLTKVNREGNLLSGAVFRLEKKVYLADEDPVPIGVRTGIDKNGKYYWSLIITELITDHNGQIAVKNMPFGQYRFIETSAPPGYILDITPYEFTISEIGSVKLVNSKFIAVSGNVQSIRIYNFDQYHPMPTPLPKPIPTLTPTTAATPTHSLIPTKFPAVPSITTIPNVLEEINKQKPIVTKPPAISKKPDRKIKRKSLPTGFNLPKTGGSVCYAVCTYGGIVLMLSGIAIFIISRKK